MWFRGEVKVDTRVLAVNRKQTRKQTDLLHILEVASTTLVHRWDMRVVGWREVGRSMLVSVLSSWEDGDSIF